MSNLESKLSASLQNPRRRPGADKGHEAGNGPEEKKAAEARAPAPGREVADLNAGGGRGVNPPRIWPD